MPQLIRNPLNIVHAHRMCECHVCESEYVTCYSHSKFPDLRVCGDCLSSYGGWHGHPLDAGKSPESFEIIEAYLARR